MQISTAHACRVDRDVGAMPHRVIAIGHGRDEVVCICQPCRPLHVSRGGDLVGGNAVLLLQPIADVAPHAPRK